MERDRQSHSSIRFITIFVLSFDLSLSCKLQLTDLIIVSEYVFFVGKEKRQMDGKFLVTMHTNCHFQLTSVKIKKNVAVDEKSSFIFCTQYGPQNAGNGISELPDFKIF